VTDTDIRADDLYVDVAPGASEVPGEGALAYREPDYGDRDAAAFVLALASTLLPKPMKRGALAVCGAYAAWRYLCTGPLPSPC
jgi:hypothetical protein